MKKNEESGFILMIVIMLAMAIFIIGFAVYRITQANDGTDSARSTNQVSLIG